MKEKFNTVFSENLKRLRKLEKLTQRDISNILDTDRSAIANYERGARVPPIEVLVSIANHFNVSLDYLICREFCRLLNRLTEKLSGQFSLTI